MQKQKRGFWLFIFSLIPGAGEMYMGFKKQGISIMFLFWGVFAIGACTGMDWLVFLIPIIWFYSFFNVHNLKSLSEEEFYSIEDSYVLHMDELAGDISSLLKHHGKITAILLIFLGASILWNTLVDFLYMILPGYLADMIGRFTYHLPQLVIAAAIILAGIYILTRKKDALDEEQPDTNDTTSDGQQSEGNDRGSGDGQNGQSGGSYYYNWPFGNYGSGDSYSGW